MTANHRYTWRYAWPWIGYYLRRGRFMGAVRAAWLALVLGADGEACQFCGRCYVLWRAPDAIWRAVMGGPSGLSCPSCFDRRANALGTRLHWAPEPLEDYFARQEAH